MHLPQRPPQRDKSESHNRMLPSRDNEGYLLKISFEDFALQNPDIISHLLLLIFMCLLNSPLQKCRILTESCAKVNLGPEACHICQIVLILLCPDLSEPVQEGPKLSEPVQEDKLYKKSKLVAVEVCRTRLRPARGPPEILGYKRYGFFCQLLRFLVKIMCFFGLSNKNHAESLRNFIKKQIVDPKRAKLNQKS